MQFIYAKSMFSGRPAPPAQPNRFGGPMEGLITMRAKPIRLASAVLLLTALPAFALHKPHHLSAGHASIRHGAIHARVSARAESRRPAVEAMPSERATEIQTALIQRGYLSGEPTGTWDAQSAAAMQKLQADNGWQTRLTPDARALIKLGLGPQQDQTSAAQ
jgi:hypothetical protein